MNVSSVKNLNGETFSAVQDADLTTVVQTNSGNWQDITAYQNASGTYMPSGQFISARGLDQIIRGRSTTSNYYIGFKNPDNTQDTPAVYLQGQFGSAYYKENELKLGRNNMTIAFNIGGAGPKISAGGTGTMVPSYIYLYNSAKSASLSQTGLLLSANDTTSGMVNIPSISAWNDTTSVVQSNSSNWGQGGGTGDMSTSLLEYNDNSQITGYNGTAFAGGGDVPTGTMNVSSLEYNAVNEISGYNGSAIAQYGAEKQWLVHDDTIVSISNSAQYAFGCNISALQRLMGIDETVLYDRQGQYDANVSSLSVSEPLSSFNYVRFYDSKGGVIEKHFPSTDPSTQYIRFAHYSQGIMWASVWKVNENNYTEITGNIGSLTNCLSGVVTGTPTNAGPGSPYNRWLIPMKVIGVGRKEV